MPRSLPKEMEGLVVRKLAPLRASGLRRITTFFGLHEACPLNACRRARACATPNVTCYQALEEDMKPMVRSIMARAWRRDVERGAEMRDIAPARIGDMQRLLAWEESEIDRLAAKAATEEIDSPYELYLLNVARFDTPESRRELAGHDSASGESSLRPSRTGAPSASGTSRLDGASSKETMAGSANPGSARSRGRSRRPGGIAALPIR